MVNKFYQFSNGFIQQSNEIDDMLKKILINILMHSICDVYKEKIRIGALAESIQLMLNCNWFVYACEDLESILQEKRYSIIMVDAPLKPAAVFWRKL
jgi:exocyst complex component 6